MAVCSSDGRSNVDATTSPLTERRMSVTSSGRSSTRSTIRCTSGLFASIEWAICLRIVVLPAFGGETIMPALALADRREQVDDPRGQFRRPGRLQPELLVGEERGQVLEPGTVPGLFGREPADTESMRMRAGNFSFDAAGRHAPSTKSPRRMAKRRAWLIEM